MPGQTAALAGLDIGTGGAKAATFTLAGDPISSAHTDYAFSHPIPGWSEISPDVVWNAAVRSLRRVAKETAELGIEILGLGLSAIGETVLAVDREGRPVADAIESVDRRDDGYREIVDSLADRPGRDWIARHMSYPLSSLASAVKIAWWQRRRPDLFDRTAKFLTFQDYLAHRLTGEYAIDLSMASRTMLFDVHTHTWSPRLLSEVGIGPDRLSPVCRSTDVIGRITAEASHVTGMPPGIPVAVGAHDQACAALGAGALRPGVTANGSGSFEAILVPSDGPITDPESLALGHGSQSYYDRGRYLAIGFHLSSGSLVRWYRDVLGGPEVAIAQGSGRDPYDVMTEAAARVAPGADGLMALPHWNGAGTGSLPPLNPLSRGAFLGLSMEHTRAHIMRAVFEGITFETRNILECFKASGLHTNELRVTGGAAKSPFWLQLKADITGSPLTAAKVADASLQGAAMLAGVGVSAFSSLDEAAAGMVALGESYQPDPDRRARYDELFEIYRSLYPTTRPALEALSRSAGAQR